MNIAWFTPFSQKSAIGKCSREIAAVLSRTENVEIICFDGGAIHSSHAGVLVRRFSSHADVDERFLSRYDIAIYNFGNYLPFHRDIYEVSQRFPGIAILHDFVMHQFFAQYYLNYLRAPADYIAAVEWVFGSAGRMAAVKSLAGRQHPLWETDSVVDFPMYQGALRGATGAVTHSEFFRDHVSRNFAGPVCRIPLPASVDRQSPVLSRQDLGVPGDCILILTIGHANPNKRIVPTIEALGRLGPSAPRFLYLIAGSCPTDYRQKINEAIARNHLAGSVRLAGEVSDQFLRSCLTHADFCVNLRLPAIEGASLSAIEEMLFGLPVIVGDEGFFAELPDECIVRVNPRSTTQLTDALRRLMSGASERARLGQAAQAYAEREYRADQYARQLTAFITEVRRARPLLELSDRVAHECEKMGTPRDSGWVKSLSGEMGALFGENEEPRR